MGVVKPWAHPRCQTIYKVSVYSHLFFTLPITSNYIIILILNQAQTIFFIQLNIFPLQYWTTGKNSIFQIKCFFFLLTRLSTVDVKCWAYGLEGFLSMLSLVVCTENVFFFLGEVKFILVTFKTRKGLVINFWLGIPLVCKKSVSSSKQCRFETKNMSHDLRLNYPLGPLEGPKGIVSSACFSGCVNCALLSPHMLLLVSNQGIVLCITMRLTFK